MRRILNLASSEWVDEYVKNGDERLVVLNTIANDIVNKQQGKNTEHVFTYNGAPITRMLNTEWIRARKSANINSDSNAIFANCRWLFTFTCKLQPGRNSFIGRTLSRIQGG